MNPLSLWWRDDDAGGDHPALARLLALAERLAVPLALAVIPARLEPACARRIVAARDVRVLQHGIAHRDHARPGERRIELGGDAPRTRLLRGLRAGRRRLARVFGTRFLPVQVPPWNRIDPALEACLPGLGYVAVSTEWRRRAPPVPGLRRVDVHIDAIRREDGRVGPPAWLAAELEARLAAGHAGPLGLMTHHRVMDVEDFARLERFVRWLGTRVRWIHPCDLFAPP